MRDPLLAAIAATACALAVGIGLLAAIWGPGPTVFELPLFVPTISGYSALAAASVAFLALGRYRVLRQASAFWAALAFGALAVLYTFYELTFPGLGPGGRGVIAALPNTSSWIYNLASMVAGTLLVAAVVASWPGPHSRLAHRRLALTWLPLVGLAGALSTLFEGSLPQLVVGDRFTVALRVFTVGLIGLHAGGSLLSTLRYRRTGDSLIGGLSLYMMAVAFGLIACLVSQQRYDVWWYVSRLLVAGGLTVVLFGLLGEYVGLYRRERERAEAEEHQRALLRAVLDQMPAGVVIAEAPSGRVLMVNHRMAQLFRRHDLPTNALEDHPSRQGFRPDGRPYASGDWPLARAIRHGEVVRDEEIAITRGDGSQGAITVNGAPVRDSSGRIVAGVTVDLDITERQAVERALRRSEHQLRELNEQLEDRVAERTRQLRGLAAELTMAEERQRRLLAQILHDDLQQVLAAAIFHLEHVRTRPPHEAKIEALSEPIGLLREAIQTSRALTSELSPTILYEMGLVPALQWLGRRMEEQQGLSVTIVADEAAGALSPPDDIKVLLYQSARELLFNVAKHAGTDQATLSLRRCAPHSIELTIADAGRGFDSAGLETHRHSGDCFGLFGISERLEYVGGRALVDSAPGRGTRVTLTAPLPLPPVPEGVPVGEAEAVSEAETNGAGESPIRILLADDHAIVRKGLRRLLEDRPDLVVVGEAGDGRAAVAMALELRPDVVLMDLAMPDMDGIEATRRIVAELPGIRVIGLSMYDDEEQEGLMREAGAVAYIPKGGPPAALYAAIRGETSG